MKNFFKGISFSSICAGALAAVTSFLLSAKIGIAGSVIGVAAGSVVSAVATQVYKNVLKASGEKIQQAVPFPSSSETVSNRLMASSISVPVMRPVLLVVIILPSLAWSIGFLARRLYGTMPDEPMRCRFFRGLWSEDGFFGVSQNDFGTATIAIIEIWSCRMPVDNCWYD